MALRNSAEIGETTSLRTEIAEILAAGLMRLKARKSSQFSASLAENSLDISQGESSHGRVGMEKTSHD